MIVRQVLYHLSHSTSLILFYLFLFYFIIYFIFLFLVLRIEPRAFCV
jgi:hypothetical protein